MSKILCYDASRFRCFCVLVCACIHVVMLSCVHVMVSAVSECVSDCIVIMTPVRTVMTVLACVYSVMVILRWRERFSNPFKHDSAHEFNSY